MKRKYRKRNLPQAVKNKKHGKYIEYKVWRWYEDQGYYVKRSYMSWGPADLWVYRPTETEGIVELLLVQVKSHKGLLAKFEVDDILLLAKLTGGKPMHVYQVGIGRGSYIVSEVITEKTRETAVNKKRPKRGWWMNKPKKRKSTRPL